MYSKKVMDHFMKPRNVGEITDADGVGEVGNPVCGDVMTFYIRVKSGIITDVRFKTFGFREFKRREKLVSPLFMLLEEVYCLLAQSGHFFY